MPSESMFKPRNTPKYMTESQCDFLKEFAIATLFPAEVGEGVQVVPAGQAHYDSFSSDDLCGDVNKIGAPAEAFLLCVKKCKDIFLDCDVCKEEARDECWHIPLTLILDIPVCRDGNVVNRSRLTAPWPLKLKASSFSPGSEGIFTTYSLPPDLLFGPYEGVYRQNTDKTVNSYFTFARKFSWPGLKSLLANFIDVSDTSLSNWLSFVAFTPHREVANLLPFVFKNCIFYRTCHVIPKNCELVVWTGEGYKSAEPESNYFSTSNLISLVTVFDYECPWCNFVFVSAEYLNEHKERCSVAKQLKQESAVKNLKSSHEPSTFNSCIEDINSSSLRRSKRRSIKSVKYFDSPEQSPERSLCKRVSRPEGSKPRERNHVCLYCKKYFTSLYTLRRHVESHLHETGFICMHCGLKCSDEPTLKEHVRITHEFPSNNVDYTDETKFIPDFASSIRGDKSPVVVEKDYTYHLGNETCIFDLLWVKLLLKMNKNIRKSNSSNLHCSSCNTQFYSHFAASLHEKNCMEGVKPYKCGHCGKRFQLYFSIVRHMSNHNNAENEILVNFGSEYVHLLNDNHEANLKDLQVGENGNSEMELFLDAQASNICLEDGSQQNPLEISAKECSMDNVILGCDGSDIKAEEEEEEALTNDAPSSCFGTLQSEMNISSPTNVDFCIAKCSNMEDFMSKLEITESAYGGRHRRHECNICGQRFYRRKHIKKHVELHENETSRIYKCSFCMLWFGSEGVVRFHEDQKHATETKFNLNDKESTRRDRSLLKRILGLLAREGQKGRYCEYFNAKETLKDKRFECEICSKKFTSFYRVRKHKIVAHNELMDLLEAVNDVWDFSQSEMTQANLLSALASIKEEKVLEKLKDFKSENALYKKYSDDENSLLSSPAGLVVQKYENMQKEDESEIEVRVDKQGKELEEKDILITIDSELPIDNTEANKLYNLLIDKNVNDEETLWKHSRRQDNEHDICKDKNVLRGPGDIHSLSDKDTEFELEINKDNFVSNEKLETSVQTSRSDQNMKKCKICGKKLSLKTSMKTHMRSHTGERRYECMYCHNRYALLSTLKRHVRIHTNDRPFRCDVCQKAYTQSSNLKRHYRQHTGERPFLCTICPKRYAEKFSLNRHLKTHKDIRAFKCKVCYKTFSEQHHLARHFQILHGST